MRLTTKILLLLLALAALPVQAQRYSLRRHGHVLAHGLRFNPEHITDDMPEGLQEMLRAYQVGPRHAERTPGRAVAPLLRSVRSQEAPYNGACPYYTYDNGRVSEERCLVGCVATCLEQVLSYYRYPTALADTLHGWQTEHYSVPDILPGTPIDWANILDDYRQGYTAEQAQAVSNLSLYCGMAAHMNWGVSSSGANLGRAFEPLWRVFGYQTLAYVSRAMYSTPTWNAMLRHELESGRPICYTGHNMALSGHAFNIDGVDEEGYYHLNWGYGGDYDGYFDLDYLNPFESHADATALGQNEGFFSNQTALFMHPEDFVIDVYDTLRTEDAFAGVRVDGITFRRQPDTEGYVIADFAMTNTTRDSLNFTFEVLTYLPTDTAIFQQADYVALSAVNLAPGESRSWPVYCQFTEPGDRLLSFSADDETLPYVMPLRVERGVPPTLDFGSATYELLDYGQDLTARLSLDVQNRAAAGYAGNLVTFCLFPDDGGPDERHWEVLSLPGGETQRLTACFHHLEDGHSYTLKVRCPWAVRQEFTFAVRASEATDAVSPLPTTVRPAQERTYDLSGRPLPPGKTLAPRGIYIKHGKKILIP